MLRIFERVVLVAAVLSALQVGLFCVYGTGSALTETEIAAIRGRILTVRAEGSIPDALGLDQDWKVFLERMRRAARDAEDGKSEAGPCGGGGPFLGERAKDRPDPEEGGAIAKGEDDKGEDWLTDSNRPWEHRRIPRSVREAELPDLKSAIQILQQASSRLVDLEDGTPALRITAIRPGSLPEELGLQPGDIILSVNGDRPTGAQDGVRLWRELKDESLFRVVVLRDGEETVLTYSLE